MRSPESSPDGGRRVSTTTPQHGDHDDGDDRGDGDVTREFGRRVRGLRERIGVSQEELGERARLHRTYVGRLERGEINPSLLNVLRIASGLGVEASVLLRGLRLRAPERPGR